jgi:putative acetyltransferase
MAENNIIETRKANRDDVLSITRIFYNTILEVNSKDYPPDQVEDWASWHTDTEAWQKKIEEQHFIIASINSVDVGFASIAPDGYLDFLFVHHSYQRMGIANVLINKIEELASIQGNSTIYSDVSITAKDFFLKKGFCVEKQQLKRSKEKELVNFRMTKKL